MIASALFLLPLAQRCRKGPQLIGVKWSPGAVIGVPRNVEKIYFDLALQDTWSSPDAERSWPIARRNDRHVF